MVVPTVDEVETVSESVRITATILPTFVMLMDLVKVPPWVMLVRVTEVSSGVCRFLNQSAQTGWGPFFESEPQPDWIGAGVKFMA